MLEGEDLTLTGDLSVTGDLEVTTGNLLTPARPAWRLSLSAVQNIATAGSNVDVTFDDSASANFNFLQGGCTLASGVITVPVTGLYQCNAAVRADDVGSGYLIMFIVKNNDTSGQKALYVIDGNPSSDYASLSGSDVFSCNANDTLRVSVMASNDSDWHLDTSGTKFSGYLIG